MKEKIETKKRLIQFDLLRILAIFFMMLLHIAGSNWDWTAVDSFEWNTFNVYDSIARCCVPIFVMISGMFFLNDDRIEPIGYIYKKRILRLVTAYLFWSTLYSLYVNLILQNDSGVEIKKQIAIDIVNGRYHLWFVPMMIGLYMVVPFLKKICSDKKTEEYYIILVIVFTFGLNVLKLIPQSDIFVYGILGNFNLYMVLGYTGYFVIGHYISSYSVKRKTEILFYVLGMISAVLTIIATVVISKKNGYPTETFYGYLMPNVLGMAVAVYVFFAKRVSKWKFSERMKTVIVKISQISFGMYLIHDFFIILFSKYLSITTMSFNAIISVPFITVCVFVLSMFGAYLLSKIPYVNKYII